MHSDESHPESRDDAPSVDGEEREITRLRQERWQRARELCALRADEAEKALGEEVRALERQVQTLEESGSRDGEDHQDAVIRLGERVRWAAWMGDMLTGELRHDPLSVISSELDWARAEARNLRRWDPSLAVDGGEIIASVTAVSSKIVDLQERRYLQDIHLPEREQPLERAFACWFKAEEAFDIEVKALERLGPAPAARARRRPGDATPPGNDVSAARGRRDDVRLDAVRQRRERYVADCAESLSRGSVRDRFEFVRRVSAEIADRGGAVLSEGTASAPHERLAAIRALRDRCAAFVRVLAGAEQSLARCEELSTEERCDAREDCRRVRRIRRRARRAELEQEARYRLEGFFGRKNVRRFDTFILFLILVFVTLVFVELRLPEGSPWRLWILAADTVLCFFFQLDFIVRWGFARWSASYFLRHFWFESLPAIPFGYLEFLQPGGTGAAGVGRVAIIARILPRLLRTVRFLRVFVFFVRVVDRIVERFRGFLDRDIVLFDSIPSGDTPESPLRQRLLSVQTAHARVLRALHAEQPWSERTGFLRRYLSALEAEARVCGVQPLPYGRMQARSSGEIRVERLIRSLLDCDVARTLSALGRDGTERVARWLRFLDVPIVRNTPVIHRLIPAARTSNPSEAASRAAQAFGVVLEDAVGVFRFWGDLSGITTGPQILDRIASGMIVASRRPAIRLLLIGLFVLVIRALAGWFDRGFVESVARLLGFPLIVLGSVCLVVLSIGFWFKRIAGEALDVYLRTADAQFHNLVKNWKASRLEEDLERLSRSVLGPERKLRGDGRRSTDEAWTAFLLEPFSRGGLPGVAVEPPVESELRPFAGDRETILLLYRDFLDGPLLHRLDDTMPVQLLGNLLIQDLRLRTLGMTRREVRKLEHLDLEKRRLLSFGPYFWFRFITESLAIETAKLVTEYNICCIPRDRLERALPERRERFERFLLERKGEWDSSRRQPGRSATLLNEALSTSEFTALHFLTADRILDEQVRERYGDEVLAALRRDRRGVVRDIFGSRPYHLLPREDRVFNPYRWYWRYLGGAKFLLLPLVIAFAWLRLVLFAASQVVALVQEVLGRRRVLRSHLSRAAGFEVAVRKINRMRKPFFMEALKLRASIDIEYLGLRIPGVERAEDGASFDEDLEFIGAVRNERGPIDELRAAAVQDLRSFRKFLATNWGLESGMEAFFRELDPEDRYAGSRGEVMRALVTAYITDHAEVRSILTAEEHAAQFIEGALEQKDTWLYRLEMLLLGDLLWFLPANRRRRRILDEFLAGSASYGSLAPRARRKLTRRFLHAPPETERLVELAVQCRRRSLDGGNALLEKLREVAWNHATWTRRIVTVRTLQTLTVIDIRAYRDLIYEVGAYAEG